jgi:ABC-type transport system involved in multi-copper enzyme maturation permease subunit
MSPIMGILFAFLEERSLFLREHANKTYGIIPYYLAKTMIDTPFLILMPLLYIQIVYYGVGLTITVERVLVYNATFICLVFTTTALGMFIGTIFTKEAVALAIAPVSLSPMIIFSGFLVNLDTVYVWLRWIQYLSPIRYAMEILVRNEFDDNDKYDRVGESLADELGYKIGLKNCFIILISIGVALRFLALVALRLGIRKVQS